MGQHGPFLKLLGSLGSAMGQKRAAVSRLPSPLRPACPKSLSVFAEPALRMLPVEGQSHTAHSTLPSSARSDQRWDVPILCQPALGDCQERRLMLVWVPVLVRILVLVQVSVRGSGKDEVRSV